MTVCWEDWDTVIAQKVKPEDKIAHLLSHGWKDLGDGYWQKADCYGYFMMNLDTAYDYAVESDIQ